MIGKTVSHYEILEKLGEGGMGVVYKAHDTKLHRTVALKFLPTQLTHDPVTKKRFIREARNASAIQHNNVCTIHEIGETDDGQMFICMAHYEGQTLDRLLAEGEITAESTVDTVIQIAEGLAKAHEAGIIHRDIKPANVLVTTDGVPKLLDFGLAKLGAETKVTKTGVTVGTVAYMSPEQASGGEVDARSDIFSLGVVLYELLAGALPFPGDHSAAVLYGIMNNDPSPITNYWSDAPESLQNLITKALQKDREGRHQSALDLVEELVEVEVELGGTAGKRRRTSVHGRKGVSAARRMRLVGLAASVVILASVAALVIPHLTNGPSNGGIALAVMDFSNLTDPDDEVQTAGIAGLLHVGFVQNVSARVVSPDYLRDLGRRLFGADSGPVEESQVLEVAKESGADVMLAGQIGSSGEIRYITWRLVDTQTGESLGAMRVDGDDLLTLADDIVSEVVQVLESAFGMAGVAEPQSVGEMTTGDPKAHEYFVQGTLAALAFKPSEAVEEFGKAIAIDSTFALAHFELARAQHSRYEWELARKSTKTAWHLRTRLSVKDRLRLDAWRAQINYRVVESLDVNRELVARWPDDRELLRELMRQLFTWWFFAEALEVSQKATALYPDDENFAYIPMQALALLRRTEEALTYTRDFVRRYPDKRYGVVELAYRFADAGQVDSFEVYIHKALTMAPDNISTQRTIATMPFYRGNLSGAIDSIERFAERDDLTVGDRLKTWQRLSDLYQEAGRYRQSMALMDSVGAYKKGRVTQFYHERWKSWQLLNMGGAREVLRWAEAVADTLAVGGAEIEDPQFYGIARWTAMQHRAAALVKLDSTEVTERTVDELLAASAEYGNYARLEALYLKAMIALKKNDVETARVANEEMEAIGRSIGATWDDKGELKAKVCRLEGRLDEAEQVLRGLLAIYAGHALGYYELGQLYEEMNRPEDAAREYERFLEMWSEADESLPELTVAQQRLAALVEQE
jgi:tRNA A-37 threonylcarbamoyl transferase component Bud32/tetratricopeptide (TPR) repeat protein